MFVRAVASFLGNKMDRNPLNRWTIASDLICAALATVLLGAAILASGPVAARDIRAGDYLAARHAGTIGDHANAAAYYDAVIAVDPNNQNLLYMASLFFLADGQVERAIELSERLAGQGDQNGTAVLLAAVGAAKRGDFNRATALTIDVPESGLNRLLTPMVQAWTLVGGGRVDEGMEALGKLGANVQYASFELYMSALIHRFTGDSEAADAAFRAALEFGAGTRQVEAYGNFLEQQDRMDDAIDIYQSFLEVQPSEVIAAALSRAEGGTRAIPMIASVTDGLAEVFHTVSSSLSQENAANPTRNFARMAVYLRPDFDAALMVLSKTMEREDAYEAAVKILEQVSADSVYSWDARMQIALNLNRLEKMDEAVTLLRAMAAERPGSTEALTTLGDVLRGNDQFAEAAEAYSRGIDRIEDVQPGHWGLFYTRGTVYERSNQWEKAEVDFLRALELQPEQPYVLNYLGYSWIELGRNIQEATQMIVRAVEQQPTAGFIVDSLGWGHYKLENYEEAARHLERAVQLTPGDPTINDHLGDAYWRVGRKREAVFQWQHALDLGAEEDVIPLLQDKIANGLGD